MTESGRSAIKSSPSLLQPQSQPHQQSSQPAQSQHQPQQQRGSRSQGSSGSRHGRRQDPSRSSGRSTPHDGSMPYSSIPQGGSSGGGRTSESLLQPPVPIEFLQQSVPSSSSAGQDAIVVSPSQSQQTPVVMQQFSGKVKPRVPVWMTKARSMMSVSLHQEINFFYDLMKATVEEERMRKDLVTRLSSLINRLWPSAKVTLYGSCLTGTCLPMSDVDIVVLVDTVYPPLHVLADALRRNFPCDAMDLLTTARVPLIKLRDSTTKLVVDISFNQGNGPRNSETVLELMKKYPEAKPLIFVLKYFLFFHSQNEVYLGGLGSYCLTLMIVFYIQKHAEAARKTADAPEGGLDLGQLLRGFFRFFGFDFDYENNGISVLDGGSIFSKRERGWYYPDKPFLLALEDPCDRENDVGRLAFNIPTVSLLFRHAYDQLILPERYPHVSFLIRILDVSPQMSNIRRTLSAPFRGKSSKNKSNRKKREQKQAQTAETSEAGTKSSTRPESTPTPAKTTSITTTDTKTSATSSSEVSKGDSLKSESEKKDGKSSNVTSKSEGESTSTTTTTTTISNTPEDSKTLS